MAATAKRRISFLDHRGKRIVATVELIMDLDSLAMQLGIKALKNKSRRSKLSVGVTAIATQENDNA